MTVSAIIPTTMGCIVILGIAAAAGILLAKAKYEPGISWPNMAAATFVVIVLDVGDILTAGSRIDDVLERSVPMLSVFERGATAAMLAAVVVIGMTLAGYRLAVPWYRGATERAA